MSIPESSPRIAEAVDRLQGAGLADAEAARRVLFASNFVLHWVERAPDDSVAAFAAVCGQPPDAAALRVELEDIDRDHADEDAFKAAIRRVRNREQARIAWRAITAADDLDATLSASTGLADACITVALARARRAVAQRFGVPRDADGAEVPCIVLGMGKLGGGELNFSSDVDLMLFFGAPGECDGAKARANDEYFAQVVRLLTAYLAESTAEGFVYRVDWALRPFGLSGPAAMHFAAAEDYYQTHGREWERYAMIKARMVAGDHEPGARFMRILQPFVYRRYLDYTAIESLRELKGRIAEDLARRRQSDNIKLGRGGIRDLEFVVQAFQLIRGGHEEALRNRSLRATLAALGRGGHMPPEQCEALDAAYALLRRVENALQMRQDGQTHSLPDDADERAAVAAALERDWDALRARLDEARETVASAFDALFAEPEAAPSGRDDGAGILGLWQGSVTPDDAVAALVSDDYGEDDARKAVETVDRLRRSRLVSDMRELSQSRLGDLLDQLFREAKALDAPGKALSRALEVVERLAGRGTYVSLLRESEIAREQLLRLCMASPWIAHLLAQQPMLLDQLLDSRALYEPPDRDAMAAELRRRLDEMPEADIEARMNLLRRYRQEIVLRVAAADRLAGLPLPKVSDRLTWLAEVIVEVTIDEVRREMRAEYGAPLRGDDSEAGFAVIGYGKLGGIEMGYGSDLDVVFLHDCDDQGAETQGGRRSVAAAVWFSRFAQRLVHWLSTQTAAGRVYEVDLQLRPSGSAGLLVTSFEAFAQYQRQKAWTWEHQALVRARHVCGTPAIGEAFETLRRELLCIERDAAALATEIVAMRDRMRKHLDTSNSERWDVKQGPGGLADLEFATQFLVMCHAHGHPALVDWPDQWRQTDALAEAGLLASDEAEAAVAAYRELRALVHERALDEADGTAPVDAAASARAVVGRLWQRCEDAAGDAASS
ncbi:bifunctional [glutamate--ammonia ligase]-adenylyl-L-tyrosine phosphorylase/[glutamate--ammonia-ligase] adenylyltransferase [Algiphilus sp.]|uniref:bifunctional [glutamate--ammonia ligase]-adenylyl-L-tyrosine phosphorylase/[glutamate--ammonia-ligase] adenylyltransferase n=1 Tax=Algiphilus sp. TaxID=1872431 RepID=UPI0025BB2DFC|nr:bifunctional [glutamate--ammonia ligase]-adenylyl-L-tyrosine phosphorylase/[glutamate--ammonia-ligase] adenylyltransferase [Algiphilus sp.]MCK5770582.1 bifunctional [glutamate--ammonia ligase]-adenylyl-L-tyrosine phosphorylase/[glutamate--ammonia-ligase] adenylyltransferase [Algiphilus sp.]